MKTGAGAAARGSRRRVIRARRESRCRTESSRASASEITFGASVGGRGDGRRVSPSRRRLPRSTTRRSTGLERVAPRPPASISEPTAPSVSRKASSTAVRPGPRLSHQRRPRSLRPAGADSLITGKTCRPTRERSKRSGPRPLAPHGCFDESPIAPLSVPPILRTIAFASRSRYQA